MIDSLRRFELFERRTTNPDGLTGIVKICSALSFATLILIFLLLNAARPEIVTSQQFESVRTTWDRQLLSQLFQIFIFGGLVAGVGLVANSRRLRRETDWVRINLIVLWLVSTMGLFIFIVR